MVFRRGVSDHFHERPELCEAMCGQYPVNLRVTCVIVKPCLAVKVVPEMLHGFIVKYKSCILKLCYDARI